MEQIIEFISKNLLYVIFLVWAVLGVFKRKSSKEQQEQRAQGEHPNPAPDEDPIDMSWDRIEEAESQYVSIESEPQMAPIEPILAYEKNVQEPSRPNQRTKPERTRRDYTEENEGNLGKLSTKEIKSSLDFKGINSSNVVQGVIWSQVLGNPRSKDPHRTLRSKRNFL